MSIEEVIEKATIKFPMAINLKEAEKLLEYVAEELPASISYKASYNKSLSYFVNTIEKSEGATNLSASISRAEKDFAHDIVEFQHSKVDDRFLSFKFQSIPGYSLEEHRLEIRKLWNDVREIVGEYFKRSKS